ncbi:MAG: hypothetical protein Q8920_11860 [Bacillota bacterium]|nr:hypothetical protein [Bacillota bacterium]
MKITEDVYSLEASKRSHVFLIGGETLIDTGMPGWAKKYRTGSSKDNNQKD